MAYSKKIPPVKIVFTRNEYNILMEILTSNSVSNNIDEESRNLSSYTKEKMVKFSIPIVLDDNSIEINLKLHIDETIDIISALLTYLDNKIKKVDYYQLLIKYKNSSLK